MNRILLAAALVLAAGCVPKQKYDDVEQRLQQCQERNQRMRAVIDRRVKAHEDLMRELKPLVDQGLLEVEVVDGRTTLGMRAEVLFASGSANLSDAGRKAVQDVARVLAKRTDEEFQVEGHTDDQAISTPEFADNWALGAARAINVMKAMVDAGMPADRLSAATFGPTAPAAPNTNDANRARNRRIEIVLMPDLSDLPGYDDMMKKGGRKRRGPR